MRTRIPNQATTQPATGLMDEPCRSCGSGLSGHARALLGVQKTAGNQAAGQIVQRRLSAGNAPGTLKLASPGGSHEQEAERNASRLSSMPAEASPGQSIQESGDAPSSVGRVLATPGSPLQATLRAEMEAHFGYDFSAVRVHDGGEAAQSAKDANAEAYTAGRHVVFGEGRYAPETHQGKRLIAHELTHVVQQSRSRPALQRLIRSPYPWRGVIIAASGANVRSSPDSKDNSNVLFAIPKGATVKVLSASGDWLRVETTHNGKAVEGYVHHPLVDDATSAAMETSVGTTMVWKPSGPGSGTDFETWASASKETPFPAVTNTTVMNCWEAVLLSAYRAGAISWQWIHKLYVSTPTKDWVDTMSKGARQKYTSGAPNQKMPQRGDLVFFNGIAHVALATGKGSEVYTFWPPPNTPFKAGGTPDKVKVFTIEDLVDWWGKNMPPAPTVEFAAPAW